ncbi:MAG TPA: ATP-binding cassette domain-containing protein [Bacteroidota bacterium]|nr:ATP-binding cassette domain-containing protein [Bacteroidota bacterium]
MIEVEKITKTFSVSRQQRREMGPEFKGKHIDAVREVSFTCRPGRIFTLLGPNGAGKTTMLRMIATMLKPSSGTITVAGIDVVKEPVEVRKRIGFLTGNTGLYARLTPDEMIKYYADLYGMDAATYARRRDQIYTLLGIHEFAGRRIGKLSSGMKQKVSLARTIIHNPDVVVFDEPTAALDVVTSRAIIQLIKQCREENKTVIFSTHRMGEVSLLSDDLAIIHRGTLIFNGTYKEFETQMQTRSVEDEFVRLVEAA